MHLAIQADLSNGLMMLEYFHTAGSCSKQAREAAGLGVDAIIAKGQKGVVFVLV